MHVAALLGVLAAATLTGAALAAAPAMQAASVGSDLTVSRVGRGSGTVTSDVGGINCGVTCTVAYGNGTTITLTANPAPGSQFTG